jgi:hypothetical protein
MLDWPTIVFIIIMMFGYSIIDTWRESGKDSTAQQIESCQKACKGKMLEYDADLKQCKCMEGDR